MSSASVDTDASDDAKDDVLAGHAQRQLAINPDLHGERLELPQSLRCEHVLHLGRADAHGEGS